MAETLELPMQGIWLCSLVRELDPTCCNLEPAARRLKTLCATKTQRRQINFKKRERRMFKQTYHSSHPVSCGQRESDGQIGAENLSKGRGWGRGCVQRL